MNSEQNVQPTSESGNSTKPVLPAVIRPKMASEALDLLKLSNDIEVENEYVFDLMRYVEMKESNISFKCRVNQLNQGWTVIQRVR